MRFYWLQDRCNQGQFIIYWAPGSNNLVDYHTKHHPPAHHKKMRPTIMHTAYFANSLINCLLRGCANNTNILTTRDPIMMTSQGVRGSTYIQKTSGNVNQPNAGAKATNTNSS